MDRITVLQDKHVVLGVTGSIACYKAVDLASKLTQAGASVEVVMTEAAQRFVTPLTFEAVTGRPVYTDMWQSASGGKLPTHIAHVGLGDTADILAVIPATADTLARLAQGRADDMLTVAAISTNAPMLVAPAMDAGMYGHPAVQDNIRKLHERGVHIVEPDEGRFASGRYGKGRLPETDTLIGHLRRVAGQNGALYGQKVVVSAGGTREIIDPVRYITNRSTGRQGHALAQAALDAGAREVVLITAALDQPTPVGAVRVDVDTTEAMHEAVMAHSGESDLLIMAAAVADFRPQEMAVQKIKKAGTDDLTLPLTHTPDILLSVKKQREQTGYPRIVIGFAAESENLLANAREKLERKGLDLLIANDITAPDAGFAVDTNRVVIMDAEGGRHPLELTSKARVGEEIISRASLMLSD